MKIILLIMLLCVPVCAQQPQVYLIDKGRALEIYKGDSLQSGDLAPFTEGSDTKNKIALVLKSRDRDSLLDAIEMTGLVPGRKVVPETCFGSKAQDCSVSHRPAR